MEHFSVVLLAALLGFFLAAAFLAFGMDVFFTGVFLGSVEGALFLAERVLNFSVEA